MCLCVAVWVKATCVEVLEEARDIRFPGARDAGCCELPIVGAGNRIWIVWRNRRTLYCWIIFPAPLRSFLSHSYSYWCSRVVLHHPLIFAGNHYCKTCAVSTKASTLSHTTWAELSEETELIFSSCSPGNGTRIKSVYVYGYTYVCMWTPIPPQLEQGLEKHDYLVQWGL